MPRSSQTSLVRRPRQSVEPRSPSASAGIENPATPISERTINNALKQAAAAIRLTTPLTAHVCKHTYCTNYVRQQGHDEFALEKLSRLVGTSVAVLRDTCVHLDLSPDDWATLRNFGNRTQQHRG